MRRLILATLIFTLPFFCQGQKTEISGSRKTVRVTGDVTAALLPASCLVATLLQKDYTGLKQGVFTGLTAVGITYGLKLLIDKERPDHSNNRSFPSLHSSTAFASAAFLQRRYGWKWGAPAYAIAAYTGWTRIYGKKHDTWDVLAGAAIGVGCAYIFTRPFLQDKSLTLSPVMNSDGVGFYVSYVF